MSFPRYPKYKDSGVEWLGQVPEHWGVTPLKHLAQFINGDAFKPTEWAESGIPIIRIQNLNGGEEFNYFEGEVEERYLVHDGDLLFGWSGNRGTSFGPFLWRRQEVCALNQHIFRVVPNTAEKQALFWILKAVTAHVEDQAHGIIGMVHITKGDLGAINVPFPAPPEQTAIAAFLDQETGKIDGLVAEQRRLMELLKEKRQAVISHAVTKGLNPHAPLKPSGIEWLGDVPVKWEAVPLKHLCCLLKDGTHLPPPRVEEGIPLLSVRNLIGGHFVPRDDDSLISEDSYQELCRTFVPQPGDVLLAIIGATLGKTAVINEGLSRFHIQRSLAIFRTRPELLLPTFLNAVYQAQSFQALLWSLVGFSAQPGIYLGELQNIRIPLPPPSEQREIVAFIQCATSKFDTLTAEAQRAIDLLQERRTALISAAVTGQIDVRHVSPGDHLVGTDEMISKP